MGDCADAELSVLAPLGQQGVCATQRAWPIPRRCHARDAGRRRCGYRVGAVAGGCWPVAGQPAPPARPQPPPWRLPGQQKPAGPGVVWSGVAVERQRAAGQQPERGESPWGVPASDVLPGHTELAGDLGLGAADGKQLAGLHADVFERLTVTQTTGVAAVGGWSLASVGAITSPEWSEPLLRADNLASLGNT